MFSVKLVQQFGFDLCSKFGSKSKANYYFILNLKSINKVIWKLNGIHRRTQNWMFFEIMLFIPKLIKSFI